MHLLLFIAFLCMAYWLWQLLFAVVGWLACQFALAVCRAALLFVPKPKPVFRDMSNVIPFHRQGRS